MISLMRILVAVAALAIWMPASGSGARVRDVIGAWEGESKCTVADSPCHDEHVLLQVAADKKDPERLTLDAYKIVEGAPEFMGTLACRFQGSVSAMSCTGNTSKQDDWEFQIAGDTMTGRLTIENGKTLYRRISVHKASAPAK
jgi:hypothetical protein